MRKIWTLFSQVVTVLLAMYFVVATLKPQWLDRRPRLASVVPILEAPADGGATATGASSGVSFRHAAHVASAAVVSISTSTAP
mgnify:FL=1